MRLIAARCSVGYSGRLSARLPKALRLLLIKSDGSMLVHADCGGYKPLNCHLPFQLQVFRGSGRQRRDGSTRDFRRSPLAVRRVGLSGQATGATTGDVMTSMTPYERACDAFDGSSLWQ